jgi:4a-hydroxytetrahydrobiopterin dehydratase
MITPLTEEEIEAALADLPEWTVENGRLATTRKLVTFVDAIEFVREIAVVAEELNHHPDIDIRWRTVHVAVCTHDAGNHITKFDVRLAKRVDALSR